MSDETIKKRIGAISPGKRALLLQLLEREKGKSAAMPSGPKRRAPGPAPLSFAQQRLWFLDQWEPNSPVYNITAAVRLDGPLDAGALTRALEEIVRRHDVLRTTFDNMDGQLVQVIARSSHLPLLVEDIRELPASEQDAQLQRRAIEEARRAFDLAAGPLLRPVLLRLSGREHVLLLTMHHIISDGWSLGVLSDELAALYPAFQAGKPSPLQELPLQYADFAAWQRQWLEGEVRTEQLAYWKRQLAGAPPSLDLPADRPRPPEQQFHGANQSFQLSGALTAGLSALSQREDATLFMILLAAFQALLGRYAGVEDVCVGSPVAGRSRAELEGLIGLFVNTLVLRADLTGDPTFLQLMKRVRAMTLEAYDHQDVPFDQVVEALQPPRDPSRTPLFQVMFILQNTPQPTLRLGDVMLKHIQVENRTAKFDLILALERVEGGMKGLVEYSTDLFEPATIARMLGHFQTLLEGIAERPDRRLSELPLLTAEERERALGAWNDTQGWYPADACLHELFEAQAERTPNGVAVVFEGVRMTYRELNRRANRLARRLRQLGARPNQLVAVVLEKGWEQVAAVLAVVKSGAAYVPIDPDLPAERLRHLLEHGQVELALTHTRLDEELSWPEGIERLRVETYVPEEGDDRGLERAQRPDDLAYVIYTSGSTGVPKGVMLDHRGPVNTIVDINERFGVKSNDRVLALSALNFDLSVYDVFGLLAAGGTIVVPEAAGARDPGYWAELCARERVTIWNSVPALMELLVEHVAYESGDQLRTLRAVLMSGDWISVTLPDRIARLSPGAAVTSLGGATEASIWSISYPIERVDPAWRSIPYGRPLKNQRFYVLDAVLEPCPVGLAGDLYIGGVGLAMGYWRDEAITRAAFIEHPRTGERLYRTGDLGRYMPDGVIEFLGRKDFQVKLRGFRIELGEIEVTLMSHPAVREAVVMVREDTPGDKRLVAYVIPHEEPGPAPSELREYLKDRLPEYMVPPAFVVLSALPLTPNGKVDRRSLPPPDGARPELEADFVAPRTPTEEKLSAIWAQVLGLEQVGVLKNFFSLGGDSILAIQVVSRAHQAGLGLSVRQLFERPTVAALAAVATAVTAPRAEQGLVIGSVALTPVQRWFFEQDRVDPHHFNQAVLLEVRQALSPSLIEEAVQKIVRHHDALRLRFAREGVSFRQTNAGLDEDVSVDAVNLSAVPPEEKARAVEAAVDRLQASLNLTQGPLLRVALLDLGPERTARLAIVIHHLAVDGVSWRILLEDLETAVQQLRRGEAVRLPFKTTSFRRWAERLSEHAQASALQQELSYWLASGCAHHPLPIDLPNGANTVASARTVEVSLGVEETRALLQDVAAAYRSQINDALLTALAQAFASWTGQRSLRIDLEGHGREEIDGDLDVSRTVGWFTALFPVEIELPAAPLGEALKSIKEQLRRIPNRGLGYGLLRYLQGDSAITEQLRALPPAEVSFNYLGQLDQSLPESSCFGPGRESTGFDHSPRSARTHLLEIFGRVVGGKLHMGLTYSEDVHHRATIESLGQRLVQALRALISHSKEPGAGGRTPSDFPLVRLSQPALDRLVGTGREIDDVYPLSPMQQGMLFETLCAPAAGAYVEQLTLRFSAGLKVEAFKTAWRGVMARHPILRSAVAYKDLEEPLQIVSAHVPLPWKDHDFRGLSAREQGERTEALLSEERSRSFDMRTAPLTRFLLIQLTDEAYRFIWSFHHILLDGWSLPLLFKDVRELYEAARQGKDARLESPRPYRDYIAWLKQQDPSDAEAFWRETLRGFRVPTPLPKGRRNASREPSVARQEVQGRRISAAATTALLEMARRHELTLNTVVQGAWALLLSHYSGEDDVVFGATVSGRSAGLNGMDEMVGLFINTVPVRARRSSDMRLLDLLNRLQQQQAERLPYEHSPLVQVQRWSQVPPGEALFTSLLVVENYPVDAALQQGEATLVIDEVRSLESETYPLLLEVVPGSEISLRIAYSAHVFEASTISRMLGQIQGLLEGMAAAPEQRLSQLSFLSEEERRRMVVTWNDTAREYPHDRCVHELFEAQVDRSPEALAVTFEGRSLTYRALNARANQLAHRLRALGVKPDMLVGICMERSMEVIVAILGVLKAGGAYVSLDPTYPAERLTFMLQDARVPVLITQERLLRDLPACGWSAVCLDTDWGSIAGESVNNPVHLATPGNLAYVIYTSGSTGQPKGILLEHRGLCNLALEHARHFDVRPDSRLLQFVRFGFDVAVGEVFMTLLRGATLCAASDDAMLPGPNLIELLLSQEINIILIPSSALAALPDVPLPALRSIITGAEACPAEVVARWAVRHRFFNAYGPAETTVTATFIECRADGGRPPIGRPIANVKVYVLDAALQPVSIGVSGELYIGGVGLARGYLNRPALTAEKFVPNPFSREPGSRLYRTGDVVSWLPDGTLEFLGRIDDQVKIRGFRIELGEVEAVLQQHPAVREAVVLAREDVPGDRRLVAYLTLHEDRPAEVRELRGHMKEKLPHYMVPAAFVVLPTMPLTPNAKIDRRALPAPEGPRPGGDADLVAPRTAIEEVLAGIWADVLGLERVGIHDSFFELGGHSLMVTQVMSRLPASFGVELPLRAVFEAPTVAALAERIEVARHVDAKVHAPPLRRVPRQGDVPLSFAQQRLWFLDQLEPNSVSYSIPLLARLSGPLEVAAFEQSLLNLVRRHEALRTLFPAARGRPRQITLEEASVDLPIVDLRAIPPDAQDAEIRRRAEEEFQRPFDLARGPLLRLSLLQLAEQEHVLLLNVHHIIFDGWSGGILLRELSALYAAARAGAPSSLPELPLQYIDFAVWQRQWLEGERRDAQLAYWKQQLAGAPALLDLPTDRPRPVLQSFRGAAQFFQLPAGLTRELTALAQRAGVTRFMLLLAAFQVLLARHAGAEEVSVGSPVAGRVRPELEGMIGLFVNTLVLRTSLAGDPSFLELLGRVRDVTLGAYDHQDVPFDQVVEALQPPRDPSRTPLFQVLFVLQNLPVTALRLDNLTLSQLPVTTRVSKFDMTMAIEGTEGGLGGMLEYNADLFDASTIMRMLGHYQALLEGILVDPGRRISELPLLGPDERRELLSAAKGARADYPRDRCFHELFEAQVERTPEAVAIAFEKRRLSYRELNRRANQLAHHLRALGVRPGALVGLCLERCPEMLVGLLAVLKAGGAYVPFDPAYPEDRLGFMVEDTRTPIVLTQQHLRARLPIEEERMISLDRAPPAIEREREDNPVSGAGGDDLAYIIYTSGSTGRPKGAMIHHRGLVNYLSWCTRAYAVAEGQGVPVHSSLGFDLTVTSLLAPLLVGQRVDLLPEEGKGIEALAAALRGGRHHSLVKITPSHLEVLARELGPGEVSGRARALVIGGEALLGETLSFFREHGADIRLINEYGPTETVVGCCVHEVAPGACAPGPVPIGRPIANTQIYLLDQHQQPVPSRFTGELYIGGDGVTRGYLDRPALTAERFVPDPFGDEPGARLYRTGDLGRYRPDGDLEYLGRIDHQVKIRGYRIELGEIEAALGRHPGVREAVVLAREDKALDKRLVAYLVAREAPAPSASELRAFLQESLPEFMLPAAFVVLPELPLTTHGKVDRRALPAPEGERSAESSSFIAPRDTLEFEIIQLWEEVLEVSPIGIRDDFFALGGHSLLAVRLMASIQDRFGETIPLTTLFQKATVENMAMYLRGHAGRRPWSPLVEIQPSGGRRPFFCVHPSGGTVLCFSSLARHLGTDRPFYGLQARGVEGYEEPNTQIEVMATQYIEAMRAVQPEGPYLLGGWSFGGIVAFEMAQQLSRQGQSVPLLALLDSGTRPIIEEAWDDAAFLAEMAKLEIMNISYDDLVRLDPEERLRHVLEVALQADILPAGFGLAELQRWMRIYRVHHEAILRYTPSTYSGRITLFRATGNSMSHPAGVKLSAPRLDPFLGWGEVSSRPIEVDDVPGDHESLIREPHVQTLAECLRRRLLEADASS